MRALIFLLFAATLASSQALVQRTYLVRAETATFDPHSGWTHLCVLVYPDHRYRWERETGDTHNNKKYKVYLGQLPDSSIEQLEAAIDSPDFQAIRPLRHNPYARDPDIVRAQIPREQQLQFINFETSEQRHPFEKTLKPFLNWMKDVEKQKGSVAEGETANDCVAPLIFYQRSVPDPSVNGK